MRVLITGANRGLGLEWVRQLAARGDVVFATCRHPESATALRDVASRHPRVHVLRMDVGDPVSVQAALEAVARQTDALDTLINNAGILKEGESIANLRADDLMDAFRVNAVGPMVVIQAALPLLRRGQRPVIFNTSTMLASLTLKRGSGYYSYGASKAALNMLTRTLAYELQRENIIVVTVHPGWVRTDMGGAAAPLSPPQSVRGMMALLDGLTMRHSGRFWTWEGKEHPW